MSSESLLDVQWQPNSKPTSPSKGKSKPRSQDPVYLRKRKQELQSALAPLKRRGRLDTEERQLLENGSKELFLIDQALTKLQKPKAPAAKPPTGQWRYNGFGFESDGPWNKRPEPPSPPPADPVAKHFDPSRGLPAQARGETKPVRGVDPWLVEAMRGYDEEVNRRGLQPQAWVRQAIRKNLVSILDKRGGKAPRAFWDALAKGESPWRLAKIYFPKEMGHIDRLVRVRPTEAEIKAAREKDEKDRLDLYLGSPNYIGSDEAAEHQFTDFGRLPTVEERAKQKEQQARETARNPINRSPMMFFDQAFKHTPGMLLDTATVLGSGGTGPVDPVAYRKMVRGANDSPIWKFGSSFIPVFGQAAQTMDAIRDFTRIAVSGDPEDLRDTLIGYASPYVLSKASEHALTELAKTIKRSRANQIAKALYDTDLPPEMRRQIFNEIKHVLPTGVKYSSSQGLVQVNGRIIGSGLGQDGATKALSDWLNQADKHFNVKLENDKVVNQATQTRKEIQRAIDYVKKLPAKALDRMYMEVVDELYLNNEVIDNPGLNVRSRDDIYDGNKNILKQSARDTDTLLSAKGIQKNKLINPTRVVIHEIAHHLETHLTAAEQNALKSHYDQFVKGNPDKVKEHASKNGQERIFKDTRAGHRYSNESEFWAHLIEDRETFNMYLQSIGNTKSGVLKRAALKVMGVLHNYRMERNYGEEGRKIYELYENMLERLRAES